MNEEKTLEVELEEVVEEVVDEVFEDETIVCAQCGNEFLFSAGEKAFYKEKGLMNKPKYCRECRAAKKGVAPRPASAEREMFTAVCAECGKEAKIPFQPRTDRPIYCDECFKARRGR